MANRANKYDKKTPREHVLSRPDTYIGDIEGTTEVMDIYNSEENIIESKEINYVPGLFKIYDEIIVNSRDASQNDPTCDTIKIIYNSEENYISVYNNGQNGIPVEEHPEHKMLVPSMIFGELLTSSNYDDSEERTTGRNGYGSKLANIFSNTFDVEVGDHNNGKKFKQTWTNNMSEKTKPKVTKYGKNTSYVQIKFYPDLKKFGLDSLDNSHYDLFYRRAIDLAGTSNGKLKVFWNGKKIDCNNFKKYINFYYPNETVFFEENNRWKIGCLYKPDSNNKIVSFVNGISTYRGGTHCNYVIDNIIKNLINNHIKKKNKDIKLSPTLIKENIIFFIDSVIINPAFSSQTKNTLTTKSNKFGSKYDPSDGFIKKLAKCGIVEQVIKLALFKENSQLKKNDGKKQSRLRGIVKLEDANKAGTKDSDKCSLILTEGDSAAGCARSGMSVVGRDHYGIFPLKGKLLNVREASTKQLMNNEEINHIKQIMGLKSDVKYDNDEDYKQLRYGKIIILTDQDVDGSHIKGLLMNFFHHLYPALLERKGFITSLATPIVKAFKGKDVKTFYNLTEYENWCDTKPKGYKIKYYKGLGTRQKKKVKSILKY